MEIHGKVEREGLTVGSSLWKIRYMTDLAIERCAMRTACQLRAGFDDAYHVSGPDGATLLHM